MRIVRFTPLSGDSDEISYGVLTGEVDQFGQPEDDAVIVALAGDPLYVGVKLLEKEYAVGDVRLLSPIIPRSKVIGIGKNYAAHAAEMGGDVPAEPLMFLKPNTSVIGPNDVIRLPAQSEEVHYEGELAVVIGRICRDVPATKEDVSRVIHGYTVANDVTARDLQRKDGQFTRAKGFDTFCPLGPWIETELDPSDVQVQTYLNGDLVQDGSTKDLVFDIPTLVAHVSSVMTLLPGDVILTGTPEGVGPLSADDEIEILVSGIGALTNKVAAR
ncbi:fumarylacetoacetate hydrolase family protein [Nocardioides jiangxiensis]|uniref:Fumarylacetoacetate hydrolase family protein n=1 Tax=Nocardioides jiangxiensis TaxID=3064524 RepID=A0ABT9B2R7_9ACTN|nr:fumarylacetoacetate hydrolase family protein [Nocardioides sp. WY-20]MDO7869142.1 fumarylacetoacetate hydrolase family protein [Nocardioides sp. WY-20]